jgi:hypothetical protein
MWLVACLLVLCVGQSVERLILSFVYSNEVRTNGGTVPPLTVSWGFSASETQGSVQADGIERAQSYA